MSWFKSNKTESVKDNEKKLYAFIGLGTMAKFLKEEELNDFVKKLPELIGNEFGASPENVVVVGGELWSGEGNEFANSRWDDGTPAFPEAAQKICKKYLEKIGLHKHEVSDFQLLGIIDKKWNLHFISSNKLKKGQTEITAVEIFVSAWIAVNRSYF